MFVLELQVSLLELVGILAAVHRRGMLLYLNISPVSGFVKREILSFGRLHVGSGYLRASADKPLRHPTAIIYDDIIGFITTARIQS